jgi:hypothetical protein
VNKESNAWASIDKQNRSHVLFRNTFALGMGTDRIVVRRESSFSR